MYTDLRREHGGMILMIKEKSQRLFIPFEAEYQAVNACIAYQAALLLAVDGETAAAGDGGEAAKPAWNKPTGECGRRK